MAVNKENIKKVVLAYSGGLDTSIIIPWLKENYNNCEVIAVSADVGQGTELDGLEEKAKKTGASKLYIEDLKEEFIQDYIYPTVQADAIYEGKYLLGTSFARPIIAKRIAEIAIAEGADAICHGCTGKGNDQVRFELAIKAFAPDMAIIAPWREWSIKSRDEEIDYAEAHNIPLKITRETNYSKDKNIWHLSHEGLDLEDPANEPQYNKEGFLELGVSPEKAPDKATYVTIHFEKGIPTAVDGKKMNGVELVSTLNKLGGENGIGLVDLVENRLVGMKSRGVYETPGGTILTEHTKLSRLSASIRRPQGSSPTFPSSLLISFITVSGSLLSERLCPHSLPRLRRLLQVMLSSSSTRATLSTLALHLPTPFTMRKLLHLMRITFTTRLMQADSSISSVFPLTLRQSLTRSVASN